MLTIPKVAPQFTESFLIAVQMGRVPGHSIVSKFAENPAIQAATPADIWDFPSEEIYTFSTTAAINKMSSSHIGDAIEIHIEGLDANYLPVNQDVMLDGQNKVDITPMMRVNRAYNNNGIGLQGDVYIYEDTAIAAGVPIDTTKVRSFVALAEQQTLQGIYTMPAGVTGFFLGFSASMSKDVANSVARITGKARQFEKVFRTQVRFAISVNGTSARDVPSNAFSPFPQKTDFVAHADVSANDTGVSITFDLLLVDNRAFT